MGIYLSEGLYGITVTHPVAIVTSLVTRAEQNSSGIKEEGAPRMDTCNGASTVPQMSKTAGSITRTACLGWACLCLLLSSGFPTSFGIARQESARSIRERDGKMVTTSASIFRDPLSSEGKNLLSQIVEAGETGDWMKVHRLYLGYVGYETSILTAVMHIAIRCGQFKQGASVYQQLCNLNVTKSSPVYSAALEDFCRTWSDQCSKRGLAGSL